MARNETREQKIEKKGGDVQVITEHSRAENARAEEVTAPMGVAPEKAGDRLVAVFFLHVVGRSVGRSARSSLVRRGRGRRCERAVEQTGSGLPFLAMMFHAAGLNVMDAREMKRDVLDTSRRALRDMIF